MLERLESVVEAAGRLGVQPRRVRALLAAGEVSGLRMAGSWLVERDSVDRWAARGRSGGRPLNPPNAWAALAVLDAPDQRTVLVDGLVDPAAQRRIEERFDTDLEVADLAALFRRRATLHHLSGHPAALDRIAADRRVVRTAASAAPEYVLDLIELGRLEAYVPERSLRAVCDDYALDEDPGGVRNVLLRAVPGRWPFSAPTAVAPAAVVVLDLLESGDARSSRAARELDGRRRAARAS